LLAGHPSRTRRIVQLLLLFVAAVIVMDGLVGERGLLAMLRKRHQLDELAASIAVKTAENAELQEEARRLREDPSAIEDIARRDLGLIRPGEKVFIIKEVTPPSPAKAAK
jgi:cell division protein FtsB